jgi:hypothetical protein
MTQKQALLNYLKRHPKGITTGAAMEMLGILCVHKRVAELENDGHMFERITKYFTNRYGNPASVMWYRLVSSQSV